MISRIIFGCGRLTGGASEREAVSIVQTCVDYGIRHFDTAPSYGLGTAEAVIGKTVADRSDIFIIAKVGSARDPVGYLKSYLRRLKRSFGPQEPKSLEGWTPATIEDISLTSVFSQKRMANSVTLSQQALRRDSFDFLLLHEAYTENMTPSVNNLLRRFQDVGIAKNIGYSNGAVFDVATDSGFDTDYVAQVAIMPEHLLGTRAEPSRKHFFVHSLVKIATYLRRINVEFSRSIEDAARIIPANIAPKDSAEIATIYALAAYRLGRAKLLYSSANQARLEAVLKAIRFIDDNALIPQMAAAFVSEGSRVEPVVPDGNSDSFGPRSRWQAREGGPREPLK